MRKRDRSAKRNVEFFDSTPAEEKGVDQAQNESGSDMVFRLRHILLIFYALATVFMVCVQSVLGVAIVVLSWSVVILHDRMLQKNGEDSNIYNASVGSLARLACLAAGDLLRGLW